MSKFRFFLQVVICTSKKSTRSPFCGPSTSFSTTRTPKTITVPAMDPSLNLEVLDKFKTAFYRSDKNVLAQNVASRTDPFDVCLSRKALEDIQHVFDHKVESEAKPVTNQKNSGRCWIFATLNVIRLPYMRHLNVEDFEFSQAYLFFWDKIERCNFFLNNVVETAKRGEALDGRLVSFLLQDPISDGGQWDMVVNLIDKHGLMPKKCFPESFSCEGSAKMNAILKTKLREYCKVIRDLIGKGESDLVVQSTIRDQMSSIYRVVGICLGIPNDKFTYSYYDKNKAFHTIGPISPVDFYHSHVKSVCDVNNKVCLVTDPRPGNQYGRVYTVDCLGNVVGGRACIYNNQPVELLLELTAKSIKEGEAVWFGCEVAKRFAGKQGILDTKIHNFPLVFDIEVQTTLSKADRLLYGDSAMSHAMAFTAVGLNNDEVTKLRVENSWGEDRGEKGYLLMTTEWFKEFVFEVVIDKKYVPKDVLDVFDLEPIVLPAWDPMGTLATISS